MADYLEPVVVRITGDDTGLLETLTRDQGALSAFAASTPPPVAPAAAAAALGDGGAARIVDGLAAARGEIAAAAQELADTVTAPLTAALAEVTASTDGLVGAMTEPLITGSGEIRAAMGEVEQAVVNPLAAAEAEADATFERLWRGGENMSERLAIAMTDAWSGIEADTAGFTAAESRLFAEFTETLENQGQAAALAAGDRMRMLSVPVGQDQMTARWAGFAQEAEAAEQAAAAERDEAAAAAENAAAAERAGTAQRQAAKDTDEGSESAQRGRMHWLAMAGAFAAVTAGPLLLSTAIVGTGYEIAKFGGEAQGQAQIVSEAFRSSAAQAAQAYDPAIQHITQGLAGMARQIEPDMAQMFVSLSGPAEQFFAGFDSAVEQGMSAAIPAVQAMGPVISQITSDLGPLFAGVAGFAEQMATAFTAGGGNEGLAELASEIGDLLPVLGELVGEMAAGVLPVMQAVVPIIQMVADVLNAVGPNATTFAAAGYLIYRGWGAAADGAQAAEKGLRTLADWLGIGTASTEGLAAAETGEAAAAGEAAVATDTLSASVDAEAGSAAMATEATVGMSAAMEGEAVASGAAAMGVGELLLALAPFAAIVGVAALAGYELVSHWQDVSDFFDRLGGDAEQWGSDIVDGIGHGISSGWNTVTGAVSRIGDGIKGAFTGDLGINSPSTVAAGYGVNFTEGLVQGIQSGTGSAAAASSALAGAVATGFTSFSGSSVGGSATSLPSSAPAGGGTTTITVNLTVEAPLASATASEIAAAIIPALQDSNLLNGQSMSSHTGLKGGRY